MTSKIAAITALFALFGSADASADPTAPTVDVEVDPLAYALGGYSLHAGITWDRVRLDLGAFALEIPGAFHGADGLDVYGSGFGAKLDYYPLNAAPGLFLGVQVSGARETVTDRETDIASTASHLSLGARVGYKVDIARGFYVLPWLGVDVAMSDRTQTVAGNEYAPGRVLFFPTVHFGKEF